jgi:hypothetical protein
LKGVNWIRIGKILSDLGFLGENSEKGSSRKYTGIRVARWGFVFLGENWVFALICEENVFWGD